MRDAGARLTRRDAWQVGDEEVAGEGRFYCESCCRHFASGAVLADHERSKEHKKEAKKRKWDEDMTEKEAQRLQEYKRSRSDARSAPAADHPQHHSDPATIQSLTARVTAS